jgi:hypothetical protein
MRFDTCIGNPFAAGAAGIIVVYIKTYRVFQAMQEKYHPTEIEQAAQAYWNTTQAFRAAEDLGGQHGKLAFFAFEPQAEFLPLDREARARDGHRPSS